MPDWSILLLVMALFFVITHFVRKSPMCQKPT